MSAPTSPASVVDRPAATSIAAAMSRGLIAGRVYDYGLFILAPVLALIAVEFLSRIPVAMDPRDMPLLGLKERPLVLFATVWTYAHLFAVVFRSHANPEIFVQHRFRFVGIPILLFAGFMISDWALISALVLSVFWDVYHSSMQTFGLCRIYDARWGNDPQQGRVLDYWLNHVIYIGPILAGASLMPTLATLHNFKAVGWRGPVEFMHSIDGMRAIITPTVIAAGTLFVAYYLYRYWQFSRDGYRVCPHKIALLVSTAVVSIAAWGFLVPWKAFFVANLFHGLQYFAIVWWMEKKNIRHMLGLENVQMGLLLAFLGFVLIVGSVGTAHRLYGDYTAIRWTGAMFVVVNLMHFYYDGFIWSVRRREV